VRALLGLTTDYLHSLEIGRETIRRILTMVVVVIVVAAVDEDSVVDIEKTRGRCSI
jgi:hypothetical protein